MKSSPFVSRFRQMARRPRILLTGGVILVLLLAGALALRGAATEAQSASRIGYVDWAQVQAAFLQPNLNEPLSELSQMQSDLQAEFDEKTEEMKDEEKQDLFEEYQGRLDEKSQEVQALEAEYVEQALKAVSDQAAKQGVDLVLQKEAIVHGGVDLTPGVLQALGVPK